MNVLALREFFNEQAPKRQKFGTVDCVTFVVGAVRAGWNRDFANVLQYNSRRSAVAQLRKTGGLKQACIGAMGDMISIDDLEPGDVIWFDRPASIGLLMPGYVALKMGRTIHRLEIEPRMKGWKTHGC